LNNIKRGQYEFFFIILSALFCLNAYSAEFKIEKDPVFQVMMEEFKNPIQNMAIYEESTNYRFDLSIIDIVDIVSFNTDKKHFQKNKVILDETLNKDPLNFYPWFKKLKELADKDENFFKLINRKLYLQLYDANRIALKPQYKYIDFKKNQRQCNPRAYH